MRSAILAAAFAALAPVAHAAFGYTSSGSSYTINTASANSFTFTVSSASCDITSLYFYGAEVGPLLYVRELYLTDPYLLSTNTVPRPRISLPAWDRSLLALQPLGTTSRLLAPLIPSPNTWLPTMETPTFTWQPTPYVVQSVTRIQPPNAFGLLIRLQSPPSASSASSHVSTQHS